MHQDLDEFDKKILSALAFNARIPDAHIARSVGLSKQLVNYRIKRLEKNGIIKGYDIIIDHTKLGLKLYRIGMKTNNPKLVLDRFKGIRTFGKFDVLIEKYVKDEYELKRFIDKLKLYYKQIWVSLATDIEFISNKKKVQIGQSKIETIDELDEKIIDILRNNTRISISELKTKLNSTERIVRSRLKKLEDSKVIVAYRTITKIPSHKIFLDSDEDLSTFISHHEDITSITHSFEYDYELEISVDSLAKFAQELKRLKIDKLEYIEFVKW